MPTHVLTAINYSCSQIQSPATHTYTHQNAPPPTTVPPVNNMSAEGGQVTGCLDYKKVSKTFLDVLF